MKDHNPGCLVLEPPGICTCPWPGAVYEKHADGYWAIKDQDGTIIAQSIGLNTTHLDRVAKHARHAAPRPTLFDEPSVTGEHAKLPPEPNHEPRVTELANGEEINWDSSTPADPPVTPPMVQKQNPEVDWTPESMPVTTSGPQYVIKREGNPEPLYVTSPSGWSVPTDTPPPWEPPNQWQRPGATYEQPLHDQPRRNRDDRPKKKPMNSKIAFGLGVGIGMLLTPLVFIIIVIATM